MAAPTPSHHHHQQQHHLHLYMTQKSSTQSPRQLPMPLRVYPEIRSAGDLEKLSQQIAAEEPGLPSQGASTPRRRRSDGPVSMIRLPSIRELDSSITAYLGPRSASSSTPKSHFGAPSSSVHHERTKSADWYPYSRSFVYQPFDIYRPTGYIPSDPYRYATRVPVPRSDMVADYHPVNRAPILGLQPGVPAILSSSPPNPNVSRISTASRSSVSVSPSTSAPTQRDRRRVSKKNFEWAGYCLQCNAVSTPEWRRGPSGARTLCNACGLSYAKQEKLERQRAEAKAAAMFASARNPGDIPRERREGV